MTRQYASELKAWERQRAKIMQAYRRGVSKSEIARRFGVTRQRIQAIIKHEMEKAPPSRTACKEAV